MYLDVYNHGTGRIADSMHESLLRRVRESYKRGDLTFADNAMQAVLNATEINELPLETIMNMTEHWWGYHLLQWSKEADPIVADLATRLLTRSLFKEWQDSPENRQLIRAFVESSRFDPHYYYAELPSRDVKVGKDLSVGMKVQRSDGSLVAITEYSQSLGALAEIGTFSAPPIIAAPMEIWQRGQPQ
jgi:HD superfamily phosphohydrolase